MKRAVQSELRKVIDGSLRSRIAIILFTHRLTAQSSTGISPSELLFGGCPRTRLDLLRPNTEKRNFNKLNKLKDMMSEFEEGR